MTSEICEGTFVRVIPGLDRRVYTERGSIGIVTRVWRNDSGHKKVDLRFPGGATIHGDDLSRYKPA